MTYGRILALGALTLLTPPAPAAEAALRAGVAKMEISTLTARSSGSCCDSHSFKATQAL